MSAPNPSLSAVGGSLPGALASAVGAAPGGTLAAIAEHLGMTAESVQSALKEGQSLAGLAEQQGVPRETMASLIAAQIQQARVSTGQPPLDQETLGRMADRALDRGRRPPTAGAAPSSLEQVASITYASNARSVPAGTASSVRISLLA